MQPVVTDWVAWSVGLSVFHSSESWKNSWTDRDAIWVVGSRNHGLDGIRIPHGKDNLRGRGKTLWSIECFAVSPAKTGEPVEMPFGLWTRVCLKSMYGKTTPYAKIFKILFQKNSPPHQLTCCVHISWNLADGKLVKLCVIYLTKKILPGSPTLVCCACIHSEP